MIDTIETKIQEAIERAKESGTDEHVDLGCVVGAAEWATVRHLGDRLVVEHHRQGSGLQDRYTVWLEEDGGYSEEELAERAVEFLEAETFDTLAVHYDEGVHSPVVVFVADLPKLGEWLEHEDEHFRRDAYSHWCSDTSGWVLVYEVDSEMVEDFDADDAETVVKLAATIAAGIARFAPSASAEEVADVTAAIIERI